MPDPVTGVIGAIGAGGNLLASRNSRRAARDATEAQVGASQDQIGLARETRDLIRRDNEPFRQQELQRSNAIGEIFGFNPVSDNQGAQQQPFGATFSNDYQFGQSFGDSDRIYQGYSPTPSNNGIGNAGGFLSQFGGGRFGDLLNPRDGVFGNQLGVTGTTGPIEIPGESSFPSIPSTDVAPTGGINTNGQNTALQRFEGSPFGAIFENNFGLETDAIDAGLAGQGLNLSSVRTNAKEDARQRNFGSAFGNYFNALSGFPTTGAATQANANAAQNFSNSAGQAYGNIGAAQANGAYARGQTNNQLLNGLAQVGGWVGGRIDDT